MTKRRTIYDELDPFDSLEEVDGFEGFSLDTDEEAWYFSSGNDDPYCAYGMGDDNELCIRTLYGCNYEGCDKAELN